MDPSGTHDEGSIRSPDDSSEVAETRAYELRVELRRASAPPTTDQALWVAFRNTTNALSFERFSAFLDEFLSDPRTTRRQRRVSALCLLMVLFAFLLGVLIGGVLS